MTDSAYVAQFLRTLGRFGVKPGLERIRAILHRLGNPHQRFKVIHVAGSNGKGSTASMVAAGLSLSGRRTGLYTSPHLVHYNERMRIDGEPIPGEALRRLVNEIEPIVEEVASDLGSPTEFDVGTAMAFLYFAQEHVDVAVIETGMGGRWDSTNVVDPVLSIITPITLDHSDVLGRSVEAIAEEKAGIIKPERPVIVSPQVPEVDRVLLRRASEQGAPVIQVVPAKEEPVAASHAVYTYETGPWGEEGGEITLRLPDGHGEKYRVGMLGYHQLQNGAVAAGALYALAEYGMKVSQKDRTEALARTQVAGRLEIVERDPVILLDGAHNKMGAEQLAFSLRQTFPNRWITFVCGISKDKPANEILRPLVPLSSAVVATQATMSRLGGWEPEILVRLVSAMHGNKVVAVDGVDEALTRARQLTPDDGVICVMGSLYLVGEVRSLFAR